MKKIIIFNLCLFCLSTFSQQNFSKEILLMGCDFKITVVAKDKHKSEQYIDIATNEIKRIERLISSWDKNSQTTKINNNAGIKPVIVDLELIELIERSISISMLTDGSFDISYASMDEIWKFDGSVTKMPPKDKVYASVEKVGYKNILIDRKNRTVFLKKEGMKIGFGGIGKGYAADKVKKLLISNGTRGGIINASGDLTTWGKQSDGKSWYVGVKNPLNKNKIFSWFPVENKAVVTSGNYEKYILINNKRYSHIINPKTGFPTQGIMSVSIFAPKAELADALATSIFVMGVNEGLYFVNQIATIDCIIVSDDGVIHYSNNIENEIK